MNVELRILLKQELYPRLEQAAGRNLLCADITSEVLFLPEEILNHLKQIGFTIHYYYDGSNRNKKDPRGFLCYRIH